MVPLRTASMLAVRVQIMAAHLRSCAAATLWLTTLCPAKVCNLCSHGRSTRCAVCAETLEHLVAQNRFCSLCGGATAAERGYASVSGMLHLERMTEPTDFKHSPLWR